MWRGAFQCLLRLCACTKLGHLFGTDTSLCKQIFENHSVERGATSNLREKKTKETTADDCTNRWDGDKTYLASLRTITQPTNGAKHAITQNAPLPTASSHRRIGLHLNTCGGRDGNSRKVESVKIGALATCTSPFYITRGAGRLPSHLASLSSHGASLTFPPWSAGWFSLNHTQHKCWRVKKKVRKTGSPVCENGSRMLRGL